MSWPTPLGDEKSRRFSIVIPVWRESAHLRETIHTISSHAERSNGGFEIVIVDDGSPDDTWNVIRDLSRLMPNLRGIRPSWNLGKEAAIYAGLKAARGDAVIVTDGDLQHPPSLMPDRVRTWTDEGYDGVHAVKVANEQQSVLHNGKHCYGSFHS